MNQFPRLFSSPKSKLSGIILNHAVWYVLMKLQSIDIQQIRTFTNILPRLPPAPDLVGAAARLELGEDGEDLAEDVIIIIMINTDNTTILMIISIIVINNNNNSNHNNTEDGEDLGRERGPSCF